MAISVPRAVSFQVALEVLRRTVAAHVGVEDREFEVLLLEDAARAADAEGHAEEAGTLRAQAQDIRRAEERLDPTDHEREVPTEEAI